MYICIYMYTVQACCSYLSSECLLILMLGLEQFSFGQGRSRPLLLQCPAACMKPTHIYIYVAIHEAYTSCSVPAALLAFLNFLFYMLVVYVR
jgi:hypothetical protein